MTEITSAQETIREEQKVSATHLMNSLADLQDTLSLIVEEKSEDGCPEKEPFIYANNALISFIDSKPDFSTIKPRSIRETDRKDLLPGQHAGVFVKFDLDDGTTLKINFWGGLRTVTTHDFVDRDISLKKSHASRTEEIIMQNTQLNWQIICPNGPVIDSWIIYNPNSNGLFKQSALKIDGEYIDCHPSLPCEDKRFAQIKENVFEPINKLTKLVPTSV